MARSLFLRIAVLLALTLLMAAAGAAALTAGQCLENLFHAGHESRPIHAVQAVMVAVSVWALVALGALLGNLATAWRRTGALLRRIHSLAASPEASLAAAAADLGLAGRLVVLPDETPLATTVGLLRPVVVVSAGLARCLDPSALKAVLAHEQAHLRRRDPLRLILAKAVAFAMGGFAGAETLPRAAHLEAELAADAQAARVAGDAALRRALAVMGQRWLRQEQLAAVAAFAGREVCCLDDRIHHHLGESPRPGWQTPALAAGRAMILLSFLLILTVAVEASERWSTWCLM